MNNVFEKGQSLVELLLGVGLMAILLPAILTGVLTSRQGKTQEIPRSKASVMLKEAMEAVRNIREAGWTTLPASPYANPYHHTVSGSQWTLFSGSGTTNGFTEQIVFSDVSRDSTGKIVTSGGTVDPSTKQITVTISWTQPYSSSISSSMYLTRFRDNITHTETTQSDFNGTAPNVSSKTNTVVVATAPSGVPDDGQVQLGAGGGGGDWCQPSKSITTYDLPKNGVANAISAIEGSVFAGQGNNASGVAFQRVNLTTNQDPPLTSNGGSWSNSVKTNGIFADSRYAYIATNTNHSQVIILDMTQYTDPPTNSNFKQVGTIDLGSASVNGQSIFVANNYAYITATDGKLYVYDVTNRTSPVLKNAGGYQIGSSGTTVGNKILVAGSYAYIATSSTTNALRIVNISNPASPSSAGVLALGTAQSGTDVFVNTSISSPTRAYLATSIVAGKKDFYIVNIEDPSNPKLTNDAGTALGQYDTNGMTPTGVTVVTGNRAIVVGTGGTQQYQVVNISNETSPASCAGLSYATGVFGVASVLQSNGYAYSYIITGDASAELKVILGGAGGQFVNTGTFTSVPFNPGYQTAFNRFTASVVKPSSTTLTLQVAVAALDGNGACTNSSYTYVGPDGTTGTSFPVSGTTISGAVPFLTSGNYQNPGHCFRYKASFSTPDSTQSPELYDMTVNYSP